MADSDFLRAATAKRVGEVIKPTKNQKKQSAIVGGIKDQGVLALLAAMRNGVGDYVNLSLDGEEDSECYLPFRILSAQEEMQVKREMRESGFHPNENNNPYELLFVIKRLSLATTALKSAPGKEIPNQRPLTEENMFDNLSENQIFSLGRLYHEFVSKHSPKTKSLTEDEVNEIIDAVSEALDTTDPKLQVLTLMTIFSSLSSFAIFEVLMKCVKSLKTKTAQMDK